MASCVTMIFDLLSPGEVTSMEGIGSVSGKRSKFKLMMSVEESISHAVSFGYYILTNNATARESSRALSIYLHLEAFA